MKNAGKARSYGLYRHLRTSKEIIENLLNYYYKYFCFSGKGIVDFSFHKSIISYTSYIFKNFIKEREGCL